MQATSSARRMQPKMLASSRSLPALGTGGAPPGRAGADAGARGAPLPSQRHVLMKSHKMAAALEAPAALREPEGGLALALPPPAPGMATTGFSDSGALAVAAPPVPSFLSSLQLNPAQMASFIDDVGNFLYLSHRSEEPAAAAAAVLAGSAVAGVSGTAYDLAVVEHADVDANDYFTLSCSGITHFVGVDSDFTPLDQWERVQPLPPDAAHPLLRQVPQVEELHRLEEERQDGKVRASATTLRSTLFLFVPALRQALMRIKEHCCKIAALRLLDIDRAKVYELTQFVEAQHALQERLTVQLSHFSTDVHAIVRAACDDIVDQFLRQNKIVADHKMTFMERASLRSECRKLTRFLRLTDFIVVDTLQDLALDSVIDACEFVGPKVKPERTIRCLRPKEEDDARRDRNRRAGDGVGEVAASPLTVVSSFSDDGQLSVQPTLQTVQEALADVIA